MAPAARTRTTGRQCINPVTRVAYPKCNEANGCPCATCNTRQRTVNMSQVHPVLAVLPLCKGIPSSTFHLFCCHLFCYLLRLIKIHRNMLLAPLSLSLSSLLSVSPSPKKVTGRNVHLHSTSCCQRMRFKKPGRVAITELHGIHTYINIY